MEWSSVTERNETLQGLANLQGNDSCSIFIRGKMVRVKAAPKSKAKRKANPRKAIQGLSRKSRLHLLKWIAQIDWPKLQHGWFVTLTYPDSHVGLCPKCCTDQRSKFVRYTEKHLQEKVPILWRKELQVRKSGNFVGLQVPHWHLCLFTKGRIEEDHVNHWWQKCIKAGQYIQTNVQPMTDGQHAAFYLAKYLTMEKQTGLLDNGPKLANPGRAWGWMRKELLPMCESELHMGLSREKWQRLMELLGALWPQIGEQEMESFTLLGPLADEARKIIREILG